ncbi:sensor domain-containing diguanylate cyclase [Blastococcus sp. CT_GayMR19]|uniref:diguanylate cyclase domain-containing protein n=1 Tax=Blastococcus sp. CT_GayMR19 TaxID=2559608 RepID=UPI001073631C|nr:diguanylate cyclase [Blastococcus sp. CT_GayMR19]TFV79171.1 sensor domain-containing diguanylate cyclase [Blastococcus sp. CT_GayMR19]
MVSMAPERQTRWWDARPRLLVLLTASIALGFAIGVPLVPHSPVEMVVFDVVLLNAAPLVASLLCLRAARRVPQERLIWWGAAAASVLNVVGSLVYALAVAPLPEQPFPSVADVFWLASYPALCVVALALLRSRVPRLQLSIWLDGLVGALGVTAVAATLFITPAITAPHLDALATAANLAYPVADVLLLALLGAVPAVLGARIDGVVAVLCVILASKLVGDVLVAAAQAGDGYEPGGPIDLMWMANAVLTAAAAAAARPRRYSWASPAAGPGWHALGVPLVCTVAALAVLALEWGDGRLGVGEVCALACVLASLARSTLTFQELRSLHEVRRQAATDHLTGLPNRRALETEMDVLVGDGRRVALIVLDLDGFKAVNDGLGHHAGDDLLRRLGDRLRPALRPGDLLFRLGGDEFAVLLPGATGEAADECARRMHDLVCRPVELDGVQVRVGASLGIATAPDQATTVDDLLRCADRAMYTAKSARGGVRWFSPADGADVMRGRDAGDPDRGLAFCPRVTADGRVVAVVALLAERRTERWRAADLGALDDAGEAVAGWWPTSQVPVQLSVSASDLALRRLPDRVAAALLRAGLPATAVLLRLDRSALSAAPEEIPVLLAGLRSRGIPTVVETYGSGAVALARLRDLPADGIVLDPAVAADVVTDARSALVVGHTVALARALGSTVHADSVDVHTDATLARLGCQVLRTAGDPLPADDLERWLRQRDGSPPGVAVH